MKSDDALVEWPPLPPTAAVPSGMSILLLAFKRGFLWAAATVAALTVSIGIYCGLFGHHPTPIYGSFEPGWNAAFNGAVLFLFLGGPTFGLGIFVAAFVVSLVRSGRSSA